MVVKNKINERENDFEEEIQRMFILIHLNYKNNLFLIVIKWKILLVKSI